MHCGALGSRERRRVITPQLAHVVPEKFTPENMTRMYGAPRYEYDCEVNINKKKQKTFFFL